MKRWAVILLAVLAILIIGGLLFIRSYETVKSGSSSCKIAIFEKESGICLGTVNEINIIGPINRDFPECVTTYTGNECNGIKLFKQYLLAN